MKVLVTTVPFAQEDSSHLDLLDSAGIEYVINPLGRKLKEAELAELVPDYDFLIAGTEPIGPLVMNNAKRLKLISRVGVGLDSVDLCYAREKRISVSYTPEAPAPAVADLSIGLMISLLRGIYQANSDLHDGVWERRQGRRLTEVSVGLVGLGRIGGRVCKILNRMGVKRVLVHDSNSELRAVPDLTYEFTDLDDILRTCDIVSLHVPLTPSTKSMISAREISLMKESSVLVNTARGGIIDETDLADALKANQILGAAIDVFEMEPYDGELRRLQNCLLTAHMGSMSIDCRFRMEYEATQEVVRFATGEPCISLVPEEEYNLQALKNDKE